MCVRANLCYILVVFDVQVEYDEFNSISVLGTGQDPLVIPLPNAELPLQVIKFYTSIVYTDNKNNFTVACTCT